MACSQAFFHERIFSLPISSDVMFSRRSRSSAYELPNPGICTAAYSVLAILFGMQVAGGGKPSLFVIGLLLFSSGLFFNALQPVAQA